IDDGGALATETARFRDIYNPIRPHHSAPLLCRWRFTCETARAASVGGFVHGRLSGSYEELIAAR
ncbi:MAG TPA: hypothetical protein VFY56_16715, partial [Propionibacteriaceae bacterium]|nr:hypothetical protein [Propionibacteriaceae bacterium]